MNRYYFNLVVYEEIKEIKNVFYIFLDNTYIKPYINVKFMKYSKNYVYSIYIKVYKIEYKKRKYCFIPFNHNIKN